MRKHLQTINFALPIGNLDAYIEMTKRIPMLSQQEETGLAERWQKNQDIQAAKQLVLAHLRFVVSIARGYMGYGLPLGDLIQEGSIGLMKAVKRFDPTVGVRLVSFAVHWIKAEIHEFILRNWRIVKIATTKAQRKLFFKLRATQRYLGWDKSNNTVTAIANKLGVKENVVQEMEARLSNHDTDLEEAYEIASHQGDPALELEEMDMPEKTKQQLLIHAMQTLDDRSQDILKKRFLNSKKATLQDIAKQYRISAERVRQLEKNALEKLRESFNTAKV